MIPGSLAKISRAPRVAIDLALHAQQAAHRHHVALRRAVFALERIDDELAGQAPDGVVVAVHVGGVVRLQDVALQADHGDVRLHRLAHHGGERGALVRRHDQQIRLLPDERLHLRHLLAVVLLRVGRSPA